MGMLRKSTYTGLGIYLGSVLFGIILSDYMNDTVWFEDSVQQLEAMNIFIHNIISNSILLLGVLSFGIITVIYLIYNGMLLGITAAKGGVYMVVTKILPHGIFEIASTSLFSAVGLLPVFFIWYKYNKINIDVTKRKVVRTLIVATLLLLVASIIESLIMC